MHLPTNMDDLFRQQNEWQIEAILEAFNKIHDWLEKDFPEVNLQVEFNNDFGNPVDPAFRIKSRVITDKTMDETDQMLIKNELVIRPALWEDAIVMRRWTDGLLGIYKRTLSDKINLWYAKKKREGTAL